MALFGALALSAFVFAFAATEAAAQQQLVVEIDGVVTGPATEAPLPPEVSLDVALPTGTSPTEKPLNEISITGGHGPLQDPASGPPVDPELRPGIAREPVAQPGEILRQEPVPERPLDELDPITPISEPAPDLPLDPSPGAGPLDPEPPLEPVTVAFEESYPLSPYAEEPAALAPASSETEEVIYPLTSQEGLLSGATSNLEILADTTLPAAAEDEGLIDTALASLFFGGEPERAPVGEPATDPESSSGDSESPLKDTPQPASPFAPPVGSPSSLAGASVVGAGGIALLLVCVLTLGFVLPRLDGKLSWAFCDLPKPSSALRRPLERPG